MWGENFMLQFYSANTRIANSSRAVDECIEIAFGDQVPGDLRFVIINATIGHNIEKLATYAMNKLPDVTILANSCAGVIGKAGVGESMYDVAMMAVSGPSEEVASFYVDDVHGENSYEKGIKLAEGLKEFLPKANIVYLVTPGIAASNNLFIDAFDEIFGTNLTIFGGPSGDNMKAVATHQYCGNKMSERSAWVIGFADLSIKSVSRATHGFTAYGRPMEITKSEYNKIYELDGEPAWNTFTSRLGLDVDTNIANTIPIGAIAELLEPGIAEEYGNSHLLAAITKRDMDGTIYANKSYPVGTKLWLTLRDEDLIFSEQKRALDFIKKTVGSQNIIAVFQTDCLARGRLLFNKVIKDELITMLHAALSNEGDVPPWLGMYGFGEFARLGGKNEYHNYTTALLVLYR